MKFIKRLFNRPKDVMCVEILPDLIRAARLRVNLEEEQFEVVGYGFKRSKFSHESLDNFFDELAVFLSEYSSKKSQHVIFGFHNRAVATTRLNATIRRSSPRETISEAELEDLLFKAQWRIFDETRAPIASRMGISDLDLHLTDAKVEEVRLDDHKVINPIGFRPRTVEFDIVNTFASKKLMIGLREMLVKSQSLDLVIESNAAFANAVLRRRGISSAVIVSIGTNVASVMVVRNGNITYNEDFNWGFSSIVFGLTRFFSVVPVVAAELLDYYLDGGMSDYMRRKVEKVIEKDVAFLLEGLKFALEQAKERSGKVPAQIFVDQEVALPPVALELIKKHSWPQKLFSDTVNMQVVEEHEIARDMNIDFSIHNTFASLLDEYLYGEKGEQHLNQLLLKRIKWLEI